MGRGYTREEYLAAVRRLRELDAEFALTTDVIVGYPGESDEDFEATRSLMDEAGFDNAFIFKYSPRPGTRSAALEDDVSKAEKERWGRLMEAYFQDEAGLITLGVLIVDIRHKPTANDVIMHNWFRDSGCPEIVVANKLDKLKKSQVEPALALIRETLELTERDVLVPFSAEKGTGREELLSLLCQAAEQA